MDSVFKKSRALVSLHKRNILLSVVVLLVLPFFTFSVLIAVHGVDHALTDKEAAGVERAFNRELQTTLASTQSAARESSIEEYIARDDTNSTSTPLKEVASKYGLTGMVAVDKDGIALARLASPKKGDYVGLTTPWGREAMLGRATTTMGVGRGLPLLINSAVPITKDGRVQGALIGAQILNNAYALRFSRAYLKPGEEVAFYSTQDGISGSSFEDQETQHVLNIYFNKGSSVIRESVSGRIPDHFLIQSVLFHVENIKVSGLEGTAVGGILLFTPMRVYLFYDVLFASVIAELLALVYLLRSQHRTKKLAYTVGIVGIAVLVITGSSALSYQQGIERSVFTIARPDFTIYNSTIGLVPDADIFNLTSGQRVAIQVTSGGESVNAVRADIQYDPSIVRVEDILMQNSFCDLEYLVDKKIDNRDGEAVISCVRPNGFFADRAILAELLIQPLRVGQLSLQFGPGTQVLANDGLGTDVLRTANEGLYRIIDTRKGAYGTAPVLFSSSHPNGARWYSNKHISINWARAAANESFSYVLDQSPDTVPDGTQVTLGTTIDLTVDKDGVYYFHLKPQYIDGTGSVSHLKIMIDTTPPYPPGIRSSATDVRVGEVVRFEFSGNGDNLSGLQKNFYVQFDGGMLLPSLPQLSIPFLEAGAHNVTVRVFDNAENFADSSMDITVH